jgi:hypothetical protein
MPSEQQNNLLLAIRNNNSSEVFDIISAIPETSRAQFINTEINSSGSFPTSKYTFMQHTAFLGHTGILRILNQNGGDLRKTTNGKPPLYFALTGKHLSTLQFIVETINPAERDLKIYMMNSAILACEEILYWFLEHPKYGKNINIEEREILNSTLKISIEKGSEEAQKFISDKEKQRENPPIDANNIRALIAKIMQQDERIAKLEERLAESTREMTRMKSVFDSHFSAVEGLIKLRTLSTEGSGKKRGPEVAKAEVMPWSAKVQVVPADNKRNKLNVDRAKLACDENLASRP